VARPGGVCSRVSGDRYLLLAASVTRALAQRFAVAETTKLSVGKALEKLRGTEAPRSRVTRLDEQTEALKEEVRRLRAARNRLERDQRTGSAKR